MRQCDYLIEHLLKIANKNAVTVDFILNPMQKRYASEATQFDIVAKSRRHGFSSHILAEYTMACLSEPNTNAVVMSHEDKATMRHLMRVQFYLKHIKGPKPKLHHQSTSMLSFPKMDSTFYIGTAGSKTFGRGDTITHLLLSEAAFYENPRAVIGGALQAASHAKRVVIETTSNGYNWYKRYVDKAQAGKGKFRLHFHPWQEDPENQTAVLASDWFEPDDLEYAELHGLAKPQLKWYVEKREEFMETDDDLEGLRLFKQEYPTTLEESFQSTGAQVIGNFVYKETKPKVEGKLKIFKPPVPEHRYVLGMDISGGIGLDYLVMPVIDVETLDQVAQFRCNWVSPAQAAHEAKKLGKRYNYSLIVPELNNHGHLTIDVLKKIYPLSKIFRRRTPESKSAIGKMKSTLGFVTTQKSRHYLIDTLKIYLKRGLIVRDSTTARELYALEEIEGKLQAPEGETDDCVMSLGLATVGIQKLVKGQLVLEDRQKEKVKLDPNKIMLPWANIDEAAKAVIDRSAYGF